MYVYIYTHMCIQCQPNIASVTFDFGGSILDGQFISGLSDRTPSGSRGSSTFDCVYIYIHMYICITRRINIEQLRCKTLRQVVLLRTYNQLYV